MTDRPITPDHDLDRSAVHQARALNYLLDGKDNFEIDRVAAEESNPDQRLLRRMAQAHEGFQQRVVRHMAEAGVRQFIVFDQGFPHGTALHEIAQQVDPLVRMVYVEDDPVVIAHCRALLTGDPRGAVQVVVGRLGRIADLLTEPDLLAVLDLSRPVGVSMASPSLMRLSDEAASAELGVLRAAVAHSSVLALSQLTADFDPGEIAPNIKSLHHYKVPYPVRSHAQLTELFAGWEIVEPGIGSILDWRPVARDSTPGSDRGARPPEVHVLGGVACRH